MNSLDKISLMPQMKSAFRGWESKITLSKITQEIVDGDREIETTNISFEGVIQPLSPEQVQLKPEGERAWKWLQIHSLTTVNDLNVGDKILYNTEKFKIMGVYDYSLDNYIEYHLVKDYTS